MRVLGSASSSHGHTRRLGRLCGSGLRRATDTNGLWPWGLRGEGGGPDALPWTVPQQPLGAPVLAG